jgi:hypothetical protein
MTEREHPTKNFEIEIDKFRIQAPQDINIKRE